MQQLSTLILDVEEYFGRCLTEDEKDYLWICQRTGSWGFPASTIKPGAPGWRNEDNGMPVVQWSAGNKTAESRTAEWIRVPHREQGNLGDRRYIARPGNTIDWQMINEKYANKIVGIILCPERRGERICAAQFIRSGIKRIWLTMDQAESCIKRMAAGQSLLCAVAEVVENSEIERILN
jgi:hypothetical protein